MLRPDVNAIAHDVSQFPWFGIIVHLRLAYGAPIYHGTCMTLQNSQRSEQLWRYFCTRPGRTDLAITDVSNDKVDHRSLLIM